MSIIMRTSSRESPDEYLLPVWVIVWIEKLCSYVTLSIHCTPDVEMVFPYYSVFHCSLCSVPVFHWFHVPSFCVLVCENTGTRTPILLLPLKPNVSQTTTSF